MESRQAASVCCLAGAGDAEEEGYEDEYQLEDVDVLASDYIAPTPVGNFRVRPSSGFHPPFKHVKSFPFPCSRFQLRIFTPGFYIRLLN